jgi:phage terminase large subunit-like protein
VLLTADGEEGAEVYSAAGSKDQAGFVFDVAKRMVELSPILNPDNGTYPLRIIANTRRIIDPHSGSMWRVMSHDAYKNLGADPPRCCSMRSSASLNQELWARRAPRSVPCPGATRWMIAATTGGPTRACSRKRNPTCRRPSRRIQKREPRRYVVIRRADAEADPGDQRQWYAANPALGDFKSMGAMEAMYREALIDSDKLADFPVFQLNLWGSGTGIGWERWRCGIAAVASC